MSTKAQKKIMKVMREFHAGNLKSGTGDKVTDRKQALAIAISEASKLIKGGKRANSKKLS